MEYEKLNERVSVVATFGRMATGFCRPTKFRRDNGQEIIITEIGLAYPKSDGLKTLHIFDITDGTADYRLELDSETLVWRLTAMGDRYD